MEEVKKIIQYSEQFRVGNIIYDVGMLINDIEPKEIVDKIKLLLENVERYNILKENTNIAKNNLNWPIESNKLISLYTEI